MLLYSSNQVPNKLQFKHFGNLGCDNRKTSHSTTTITRMKFDTFREINRLESFLRVFPPAIVNRIKFSFVIYFKWPPDDTLIDSPCDVSAKAKFLERRPSSSRFSIQNCQTCFWNCVVIGRPSVTQLHESMCLRYDILYGRFNKSEIWKRNIQLVMF